MDFGQRLKRLREEKNLSQTELAKILNLSQPTIAYYESGDKQPTNDNLIRLANFFNVSTDYLLGREEWDLKYFLTHPEEAKKLHSDPSLLEQYYPSSESKKLAERIDKASDKTKQIIKSILEMDETKDKQSAAGE